MVISMRSTRVKQFLQKIAIFVFCRSKNTTKLLLSGNLNSKVTRRKNIRGVRTCNYAVTVNSIIQKLKIKHLVFLSFLWWKFFLREREKIFYPYSKPQLGQMTQVIAHFVYHSYRFKTWQGTSSMAFQIAKLRICFFHFQDVKRKQIL